MSLEKREEVQAEIDRMRERTGIPVTVLAGYAGGLPKHVAGMADAMGRGERRRSTTGTCPSITGCPPSPSK
jgi:hypothetical protein